MQWEDIFMYIDDGSRKSNHRLTVGLISNPRRSKNVGLSVTFSDRKMIDLEIVPLAGPDLWLVSRLGTGLSFFII